MNCFIENASRFDVSTAMHADAGENSMLIQISGYDEDHPVPLKKFKEVHQFQFEDIESEDDPRFVAISDEQAHEIANLLRRAKENNMNVIVHCHAGLCRSGAVVECGIFIGFNPPDRIRLPNTLVKKKIMKALGHEINENTSVFAQEFYNRGFD